MEFFLKSLSIFGDTKLVINWISERKRCHDIFLGLLLKDIKSLKRELEATSFRHVYREMNYEVDSLSKFGVNMVMR